MFVRVRDPETGHEFDLPEDHLLIRRGSVVRVKPKQYPPASRPRRPKHHVDLAGQSAARSKPESTGPGEATDKEN